MKHKRRIVDQLLIVKVRPLKAFSHLHICDGGLMFVAVRVAIGQRQPLYLHLMPFQAHQI